MQASEEHIQKLLDIEAAKRALRDDGDGTDGAFFESPKDLYETIDAIPYGEAAWKTFTISYTGPRDPDAPWKHEKYVVHTRNALEVLEDMADCPEFNGKWEYVPYEKYVGQNNREFSSLMSGRFAYKQAVSTFNFHCVIPILIPLSVEDCRGRINPRRNAIYCSSRSGQDDNVGGDWKSGVPPGVYLSR